MKAPTKNFFDNSILIQKPKQFSLIFHIHTLYIYFSICCTQLCENMDEEKRTISNTWPFHIWGGEGSVFWFWCTKVLTKTPTFKSKHVIKKDQKKINNSIIKPANRSSGIFLQNQFGIATSKWIPTAKHGQSRLSMIGFFFSILKHDIMITILRIAIKMA